MSADLLRALTLAWGEVAHTRQCYTTTLREPDPPVEVRVCICDREARLIHATVAAIQQASWAAFNETWSASFVGNTPSPQEERDIRDSAWDAALASFRSPPPRGA